MEDNLQKLEEDEESISSSEIASSWTDAQEHLLAGLADKANCLRWMHSECYSMYDRYNFYLTIPSIIVSALSGSATMALPSMVPKEYQQAASIVVGVTTLCSVVLTSLNQHMKTSQFAELHRAASVVYGKLHSVISSELSLRRDQRMHAIEFVKVVRAEYDRLQETAPHIASSVRSRFQSSIQNKTSLELPEILGDFEHVTANREKRSAIVPVEVVQHPH